jgi:predicted XRE-type DNA-binding protein
MSLKTRNKLKTKIKILMLEKGVSQADLARNMEVSRSAVNHVLNGRVESERIKKGIAKGLAISYKKLWEE